MMINGSCCDLGADAKGWTLIRSEAMHVSGHFCKIHFNIITLIQKLK
ncbi:MAG: hypothetical protein LBI63_05005 [Candidatus Ancillula sp.]|nr:hypothetical protein [Candidatus Ancillula sp.]